MKTIKTIELTRANVAVVVDPSATNVGWIQVTPHGTTEPLSCVLVVHNEGYDTPAGQVALSRILYAQSWNLENQMCDADRYLLRETLRVDSPADAFLQGETATYGGDSRGTTYSNLAILRVNGMDVAIEMVLGDTAFNLEVSHSFDLTNGPVNFNAQIMRNAEFINAIQKITARHMGL